MTLEEALANVERRLNELDQRSQEAFEHYRACERRLVEYRRAIAREDATAVGASDDERETLASYGGWSQHV